MRRSKVSRPPAKDGNRPSTTSPAALPPIKPKNGATGNTTQKKVFANKDISGKIKVLPDITPRLVSGIRRKQDGRKNSRQDAPGLISLHNGPGKERLGTVAKQTSFKNAMQLFNEMLLGRLHDLPPKPPSEVRIFLSSTFTDMKVERNWLFTEAYPRLKQHCAGLGLDFSMLDMRWGVTEDATNEHITETLCLREVRNCQRNSIGPNFVAFLGNKYGYRPLPAVVESQQFEILLQEAVEMKHPDVQLLQAWYRLDTNAVPCIYTLTPIKLHLPFFGDHSKGNEKLCSEAGKEWRIIMQRLQDVLRTAAAAAEQKNLISSSMKHNFFRSVTECEIAEGILDAPDPSSHSLCYYRNMEGLNDDVVNEKNAQRFMDCIEQDGKGIEDEEVKGMLMTLCSSTIPRVLDNSRIKKYSIPWREGGTDAVHEVHRQYLDKFTEDFVQDIQLLIDQGVQDKNHFMPQTEYYTTYEELLHHHKFTVEKCETFRGQQSMLDTIKAKLEVTPASHLILVAESGVGKTSLIAMTMKLIPQWFGPDCVRIVRYLGTSTESSDVLNVLRNVAGQLADAAHMFVEPDNMKNISRIVKYLPRLIRNVARKIKERIFIMLDSIDQLKNTDGAYSMKWLPLELPRNVTIIISTLTRRFDIADNLKSLLPNEEHYLHIESLPSSTGTEIMEIILKKNSRNLTQEQKDIIVPKMEDFPNALYMKLLIDKSLTWSSFTPVSDLHIASTVKEAISMLFDELENRFGKVLISRTMGYLTEGLSGLTEVELEDALSCDDEALDEVYQYHDPPVEGVVRIPALLWSRVKESINRYMTEKPSAGKTTLSWYHRQFHETATERYCKGDNEYLLHSRLVELYQASDGVKRDIYLSKRKKHIEAADRQVARQPMTSSNLRMLECIPFHCQKSGDQELQKEAALCNLKFMKLRISAKGLYTLIGDFIKCLQRPDEEMDLVKDCLRQIKKNSSVIKALPTELLLNLDMDERKPKVTKLLQDARDYLEECETAAIPLFATEGSEVMFRQQKCQHIISVSKIHPELLIHMEQSEAPPKEVMVMRVNLFTKMANSETMYEKILAKYSMSSWTSFGNSKISSLTALAVNDNETHMVAIYEDRSIALLDINNKTCIKKDIEMKSLKFAFEPTWIKSNLCCVWAKTQNNNYILLLLSTRKGEVEKVELPFKVDLTRISCTSEFIVCAGLESSLAVVDAANACVTHCLPLNNSNPVWCHSENSVFISDGLTVTRTDLKSSNSQPGPSSVSFPVEVVAMTVSNDNDMLVASLANGLLMLVSVHDGHTIGQTMMMPYKQIAFTNRMYELVTLDQCGQLCVWKWLKLYYRCKSSTENVGDKANTLQYCDKITDICFCKDYIVTIGEGMLKVWDSSSFAMLHSQEAKGISLWPIVQNNMPTSQILIKTEDHHLNIYDTEKRELETVFDSVEESVESFEVSRFSQTCFSLVKTKDGFCIDVIKIQEKTKTRCQLSSKLILNKPTVKLTVNEQYLVISHSCSEQEEFAIRKQEKSNNLPISQGKVRLYAWHVTSQSPTLKICNRQLTNIPCLVESWLPVCDSFVLIGRSRVTVFWNVETGKNDQKIGPNKIPMMYRPYWIEGESEEVKLCHGMIQCMVASADGRFVATGSDDGWLLVYDVTTGHSVCKLKPGTKPHHSSPIKLLSLSQLGQYAASLDKENVLKIFTAKGDLVMETKVKGLVEKMTFSCSDNKIIIRISRGNSLTRLLMLQMKSAK